ncbi:MAG: ABC transporter ATP-binding protein [Candidatus Izemoplasmatales bacterium]
MSTNISVRLAGVTKRYPGDCGIEDVSLAFDDRGLNLLVGPNGSGKSTILRCIVGLVRYRGTIEATPRSIGYAPEDYILPQFMTVRDFLVSVGRARDVERAVLADRIDALLDYFEMREAEHKPFFGLSTGMRQKTNLIQALLNHPKILLFDEPLRGLDEQARDQACAIIRERSKESLVIVSTHYPERFRSRNRRIVRIENGRIVDARDA